MNLNPQVLTIPHRLLMSALAILDLGNVGLARSLAILGLEESGKAIAIHRRRIEIAHEPEEALFVNAWLEKLWVDHQRKLKMVHDFLVREEYWFDTQPPDPDINHEWLGEISAWAREHNVLKQRGFYVDVDEQEGVQTSGGVSDGESLRHVIGHVHQVGWQLRLGEHIVAKQQSEMAQAVPPASEAEIERMRDAFSRAPGVEESMVEEIIGRMRQGCEATALNNDAYRLRLPEPGSNPFANLGQPGYEAETRALLLLAEQIGLDRGVDVDDGAQEQS